MKISEALKAFQANKNFDWSQVDLRGANLSWVNLRGVDLSGVNLVGADLRYADLRGANLSRADLRGVDLSGANLVGADLVGTNLHLAKLNEANLSEANLRWAILTGADLREANLHSAKLNGADWSGANFHQSNLTNTIMDSKINQEDKSENMTKIELNKMYNFWHCGVEYTLEPTGVSLCGSYGLFKIPGLSEVRMHINNLNTVEEKEQDVTKPDVNMPVGSPVKCDPFSAIEVAAQKRTEDTFQLSRDVVALQMDTKAAILKCQLEEAKVYHERTLNSILVAAKLNLPWYARPILTTQGKIFGVFSGFFLATLVTIISVILL